MRSMAFLLLLLLLTGAGTASAQAPDESAGRAARRAIGIRGGEWRHLPYGEIYFQRGLAERVALENSAGVWQRRTGEFRSYVIPLLTSLKFYPLTAPNSRVEPFIMGGIGFALGIEKESVHAIGGGGTSILTGFGTKAGAGIEGRVYGSVGVQAGVHYLYMRFNDELADQRAFEGAGIEGGVSFRLTF